MNTPIKFTDGTNIYEIAGGGSSEPQISSIDTGLSYLHDHSLTTFSISSTPISTDDLYIQYQGLDIYKGPVTEIISGEWNATVMDNFSHIGDNSPLSIYIITNTVTGAMEKLYTTGLSFNLTAGSGFTFDISSINIPLFNQAIDIMSNKNQWIFLIAKPDWTGLVSDPNGCLHFDSYNNSIATMTLIEDAVYTDDQQGLIYANQYSSNIVSHNNTTFIQYNNDYDRLIITNKNNSNQNINVGNKSKAIISASQWFDYQQTHPYDNLNIPGDITNVQINFDNPNKTVITNIVWPYESNDVRICTIENGIYPFVDTSLSVQFDYSDNNIQTVVTGGGFITFIGSPNHTGWINKTTDQTYVIDCTNPDINLQNPQWINIADFGNSWSGSDFYWAGECTYIPVSIVKEPSAQDPLRIQNIAIWDVNVRLSTQPVTPVPIGGMNINASINSKIRNTDFVARNTEFLYGLVDFGTFVSPSYWCKCYAPGTYIWTISAIGRGAANSQKFRFEKFGVPGGPAPNFTMGQGLVDPDLLDYNYNPTYHLPYDITIGSGSSGDHILVDDASSVCKNSSGTNTINWTVKYFTQNQFTNDSGVTFNPGDTMCNLVAIPQGQNISTLFPDEITEVIVNLTGPALVFNDFYYEKSFILVNNGQRQYMSGQTTGELMNGFNLNFYSDSIYCGDIINIDAFNSNCNSPDKTYRPIKFVKFLNSQTLKNQIGIFNSLLTVNKISLSNALNETYLHTLGYLNYNLPTEDSIGSENNGQISYVAWNAQRIEGTLPDLVIDPSAACAYSYGATPYETPNDDVLFGYCPLGTMALTVYQSDGFTHGFYVKKFNDTKLIGMFNSSTGAFKCRVDAMTLRSIRFPDSTDYESFYLINMDNTKRYCLGLYSPYTTSGAIFNSALSYFITMIRGIDMSELSNKIDDINKLTSRDETLIDHLIDLEGKVTYYQEYLPSEQDRGAVIGPDDWISIKRYSGTNPMGSHQIEFHYRNEFGDPGDIRFNIAGPGIYDYKVSDEPRVTFWNLGPVGPTLTQNDWYEVHSPFRGFIVSDYIGDPWPWNPVSYDDDVTYTVGYDSEMFYKTIGGDASTLLTPNGDIISALNYNYQHGSVAITMELPDPGWTTPEDWFIVYNPNTGWNMGSDIATCVFQGTDGISYTMTANPVTMEFKLDWIDNGIALSTVFLSAGSVRNPDLNWIESNNRYFLQIRPALRNATVTNKTGSFWPDYSSPDPYTAMDHAIYFSDMSQFDQFYRNTLDLSGYYQAVIVAKNANITNIGVTAKRKFGTDYLDIAYDTTGPITSGNNALFGFPTKWDTNFIDTAVMGSGTSATSYGLAYVQYSSGDEVVLGCQFTSTMGPGTGKHFYTKLVSGVVF